MKDQENAIHHVDYSAMTVKMILSAWDSHYLRIDKLFNSLSDEQYMDEVSPGRNRGIYLLGHQTAVTDGMLPLLGFGDKLYPELEDIFVRNSDKAAKEMPSLDTLKQCWSAVNAKLSEHIKKMSTEDWFQKHSAVSEEDFVKEPHRNKLNIIISRTNHQSYHIGQLVFLEK